MSPNLAKLLMCFVWLMLITNGVMAADRAHVAFLNPGKQGERFWDQVTTTMELAAGQLELDLKVYYSERSKVEMRKIGLEIVNQPDAPDFLVLVNEEEAAIPILIEAEKRGIKTLFFNHSIEPQRLSGKLGQVGYLMGSVVPDMESAGRRMTEQLVGAAEMRGLRSSDGKIHVLGLAGDEISATSIARTQGLYNVVSGRTDIALDRVLFANWNLEESYKLTSRYLGLLKNRGDKGVVIWAANDPMALGAIKALKEGGFQPGDNAYVVGLNWSPEAVTSIERGDMLLSDGGHFLGGGWMMVLIADYLNGCTFLQPGSPKEISLITSTLDRVSIQKLKPILDEKGLERIDFTKLLSSERRCERTSLTVDMVLKALKTGD